MSSSMQFDADILIIGAGLTGLYLAKLLGEEGKDYIILEARDRRGGRIHTYVTADRTPVEMGATWSFPPFSNLRRLLKELNIDLVKQYINGWAYYEREPDKPPQQISFQTGQPNTMYRIKGGTTTLVNTLSSCLDETKILLNTVVKNIEFPDHCDGVLVHTNNKTFRAKQVVTTIPPQLLVASVKFSPPLPSNVTDIASETHTWMGDATKAAVIYEKPFWKTAGKCGGLFSDCGPFLEMYDQSSHDGQKYALVGFLDDTALNYPPNVRENRVIAQLKHVFGKEAENYVEYKDTVWCREKFTMAENSKKVNVHQNNAHIIYQQIFYDGRLVIAGTETSLTNSGYMEGALLSAIQATDLLSSQPT